MSWTGIHVDDYGWEGRLIVYQNGEVVDISDYPTKKFIFTPPFAEQIERAAVFVTNGTDGALKYDVVEGDIAVTGSWQVCARISKPGSELTSDPLPFYVLERC